MANDKKLNKMTCSELNLLSGGAEYKVCNILLHLWLDNAINL